MVKVTDRTFTMHDVTGAMGDALKAVRRSPEGAGEERPLNRYIEAVVVALKALPAKPPRVAMKSDE